jgi:hypothetical protein
MEDENSGKMLETQLTDETETKAVETGLEPTIEETGLEPHRRVRLWKMKIAEKC